mmetsp:Transcript_62704/g.130336  ORF Transcript_62704/g.130336 Transcript_62704/m.130336 type:complete len:205 (+) Transcript_62704:33-647(+)
MQDSPASILPRELLRTPLPSPSLAAKREREERAASWRFIRACRRASSTVDMAFWEQMEVEESEERTKCEAKMIEEASEHLQKAQDILYKLQSNDEMCPKSFVAIKDEKLGEIVVQRLNVERLGFYELALRGLESCAFVLTQSSSKLQLDKIKEDSVKHVLSECNKLLLQLLTAESEDEEQQEPPAEQAAPQQNTAAPRSTTGAP